MSREIEVLSEKTTLTVSTDRTHSKPWGAFGGLGGGNSSCRIESDGEVIALEYTKMTRNVNRGDVITIVTPGGGGWGDPFTREPEKVLRDVREGLISIERAAEFYGVVLNDSGCAGYTIDRAATERLRTGTED